MNEITASLFTKDYVSEMIESYEEAYSEDLKLECAFEKFKQFNCNSDIIWVFSNILWYYDNFN